MTTRAAGMPRAGGSHSQHHQQQHHQPLHSHPPQHHPEPLDARALLLDVAGGMAAATLMLVVTCWVLSLGGAFQPGHLDAHGARLPGSQALGAATAAKH